MCLFTHACTCTAMWCTHVLQTYDMNPLDAAACERYGLKDKDSSWCGAMVDIPSSAAVVDFVLSDRWACRWSMIM